MGSTSSSLFTGAVQPERLLSLDVLRGLTVAAMVLVDNPGSWEAVFPPLEHAAWHGATPTDMIFPCFLVIVGVSMTLSFAARRARGERRRQLAFHVLRRGTVLAVLGLMNGLRGFDLPHLRIPGVLQRIGICYMLGGWLYLLLPDPPEGRVRQRQGVLAAVTAALLAGYWLLLRFYPTPGFGPGRLDSYGSLTALVDRALFGVQHLYRFGITPGYGVTYDPEGALSTLPSLATLLLGVLAGEQLRSQATRRRQCAVLAVMGTGLWVLGLALSPSMPLNKKLWTSTFAMFSAGIALSLLAACFYLIDLRRVRHGWTLPLIFGTNAILAYVLSALVSLGADHRLAIGQHGLRVHALVYGRLLASWLPPRVASLGYAVVFVLFTAALVYPLYRRRIFVRL